MKNEVPLGYFTNNKAALVLDRDRSTVRKIITENEVKSQKIGRYTYYKLSDIVNSMLDGERLDLQQERAKLAKEQRKKTRLQNEELEGTLVNAEEVKETWIKYVASCRAKLLSLPTKAAPVVHILDTVQEVKDALKKEVHEALNELAAE